MKQLLIKKGQVFVENIPAPSVQAGSLLVRVEYSLISTGTETTIIKSSGESLASKAKNPSLLKAGKEALKRHGVRKTLEMIRTMQDNFTAFGYSLAGTVVEVGKGVPDFKPGDRVTCAGAGKANHAEFVSVPKNLVCRIPETVSFEDAASTTVGSIALQGVRQAGPSVGENVAVIGAGLLGLITIQILKANGCTVLISDTDPKRLALAKELGADHTSSPGEFESLVANLFGSKGVDATIITAASASSGPLNQAMALTRKRGTVVVVGAVGLSMERSPFYEKEINLKISCSYGPGRYDPGYEEGGQDYPYGFVRWTENRNMQAYLQLLAEAKVDFSKLVSKIVDADDAPAVYAELNNPENKNKPLAVLIRFQGEEVKPEHSISLSYPPTKKAPKTGRIKVGMIGVGGFATDMHLPNLQKLDDDFEIYAIANRGGTTAMNNARRYKASLCTTDYNELLQNDDIDLLMISTRHNSHAKLVVEGLKAGKAVFVEKPLALSEKELEEIRKTLQETKGQLFVGFNRRFSPHAVAIRQAVQARINPLMTYYRMNAGFLPPTHWTQTEEGGGRILGEACHIFDLFNYWTGSTPAEIIATPLKSKSAEVMASDNYTITLRYEDGSVCTLIYTAQGNGALSKEAAEIFFDRKSITMGDYQQTTGFGLSLNLKTKTVDKGHLEELRQIALAMRGESNTWDIDQIFSASAISLVANQIIQEN